MIKMIIGFCGNEHSRFLSRHFWICRNMVVAAASYYKATLNVTTGLSAPLNNLAIIYKQQVVTSGVWSLIFNS